MIFSDFSDDELEAFLREEHCKNQISLRELARRLKTNPVRLLRFCNKRNIPVLSKSEALKAAYKAERIVAPMKGKEWSEEHKLMLGEKQHEMWKSMSEEERKRRADIQREIFENKPDKDSFHIKGAQAVKMASVHGSKAEHALAAYFKENGVKFIHHHTAIFPNNKLEADFYLPTYNCVVEIDGPSHFGGRLGEENYHAQVAADQRKNAIAIDNGMSIIRLQHKRTLYKRDHYKMFNKLMEVLPTLSNELRIIDVERL